MIAIDLLFDLEELILRLAFLVVRLRLDILSLLVSSTPPLTMDVLVADGRREGLRPLGSRELQTLSHHLSPSSV